MTGLPFLQDRFVSNQDVYKRQLCTYEPQWNSDVMAMWENVVEGEVFDYSSLCGYVPAGSERDLDVIMDAADWELNTIPNYREKFFRPPVTDEVGEGYKQDWICYGNDLSLIHI